MADLAKASIYPPSLRFRETGMFGMAFLSKFGVSLQRFARFSGPLFFRFLARSSLKAMCGTRLRLLSITQGPQEHPARRG